MGTDGDADILQNSMVLLHGPVVDRDAGIVDDLVDDAEGIRLRGPLEVVHCLCPVPLARCIELVDRDHLARLWFGQEVFVMESPPRGLVPAEALTLVLGVSARGRADVDNP